MESFDSVITFEDISFQYQEEGPTILEHINFDIPRGKWTSIVGHNGSGKSTLTKLMMGIEHPQEGQIYFNQQPISDMELETLRKHIGIVFQNPENQFVGSTVEFDVAFGLENHATDYETMHRIVPQVLEDVNMLQYKDSEPSALSGGQKQRVAIAGVLALNTDVIILDEATSMLDPEGRNELLSLIKRLQAEKNVTIISITHDLSEVVDSDYMIVIDQGRVYTEGSPRSVFDSQHDLEHIGLDLPFAMRIYKAIGHETQYVTYDELVKML